MLGCSDSHTGRFNLGHKAEKFEKDAQYLGSINEKRSILLSFTTDPYQHLDVQLQLTRKAIQILHKYQLKVSILTKGGIRSERDLDLLASNPNLSEYGITLVFSSEKYREEIEPFAANINERIQVLRKAHEMGIFTYVSLEPVWFAEESLNIIDMTHEYVDLYKVGKLNHHPQAKTVNWAEFRRNVIRKLEDHNKKYYIKRDLQKY